MRGCLVLLLVLIGNVASAQSSSSISGKVVDARGGQPLARCVVAISLTPQLATSLSVTTGDDGRFAFAGLAVGKYHLSASRRGYLTQAYQEHGLYSTAIAVGRGLPSENLVFRLTPQSIVYGTISDEAGEAIRGAQVKLYVDREPAGVRSTTFKQGATTDDLGKYEIAEIPPGNYYLSVSARPWYAHGLGMTVSTAGGEADQAQDSPMDVAYPTTFYADATNSDEATPIPLRGGERLQMNVTLNAQHALRLRLPVPQTDGVNFNLSLAQSVFGQPEQVTIGGQMMQGGVLEVDGVLPGQYDATLTQFGSEQSAAATHFTADVAAGATNLIAAETVEEVTVTGKISGLEGKIPHTGVTLFSRHPQHNYFALFDKLGEFSMKVQPGKYEVIGQIPDVYLARLASANAAVHGRMVEVKAGTAPVLELTAGKGFGQIDGFVASGSKRPGGVLVLLAPENASENEILFRRDQSDSDGSFTLYSIVPGRYRLMAIDQGWDLDWNDENVLRAFASKSIPIQVHGGEKFKQLVEVQGR